MGCHLTTLFSSTAIPTVTPVAPKKAYSWLPLLTVLFLFSYGLMTMLIVEQGTTIEKQRALIQDLYHDSSELSAVKGKAVSERNAAAAQHRLQNQGAQTQAPSGKAQVQTPSTQTPSTQSQTPSSQTPSNRPWQSPPTL